MTLSIEEAEKRFIDLLNQVEPKCVAEFLDWIKDGFSVSSSHNAENIEGDTSFFWNTAAAESDAFLKRIATELRSEVPLSAVFDSESIKWPQVGLDSDCDPATTVFQVHVDAFLYDDDDLDELVNDNLLSRNYCTKCGSRDVKPLTFISHSLSADQLRYIFTALVPLNEAMVGRTILDIGSRLGAVLYSIFYYGSGKINAVGVEINKDLCLLQEKVIEENSMSDCVKVINDDIRNQKSVVASASVIIMNNVFSFFLPIEEQVDCWNFLHDNIKPGTVIISNPSIEEVTQHLKLSFDISDWLDKVYTGHLAARFAGTNEDLFEDCEKLTLYSVKHSP